MADTTGVDLPPRLSEQQLFLLASILHLERESLDLRCEYEHILPITTEDILRARWVSAEGLSRAFALEFDEDGDRISAPPDPPEKRIECALERGDDELAKLIVRLSNAPDRPNSRDRHIRPSHSASFSRSLSRLEERGLVVRERGDGWYEPTTVRIRLSEKGREVAEEVLRRHSDGRYSLSFDAFD